MKKIEVAFDQAQLTLDKGEQAVKDAVTAIRNALRAGTASTKSKGRRSVLPRPPARSRRNFFFDVLNVPKVFRAGAHGESRHLQRKG